MDGIAIKSIDMDEPTKEEAIEESRKAMQDYTVEKDMAAAIKRAFDLKYGPNWQCVVGKSFGSFVTHGILYI